MLLQRGHGSTLSGFFRVFSCELAASPCSFSVLSPFDFSVSSSMEGVLGFTIASGDEPEFLVSSAFGGGSTSSSSSVTFSTPAS